MKKHLPLLTIAALAISIVSCSIVRNVNNQHCNMPTPGWGNSLGSVTRGTQEWAISGNGITQIWSDAVTASACQKTTFNGGYIEYDDEWNTNVIAVNFNADCRSNLGYPGDLFSWYAVVRFQDQLCPAPWRVPTMQDFIDLDIALGGNGNNRDPEISDIATPQFVTDNYITRWGGAFGGSCYSNGTLWNQGSWANYWSQSQSQFNATLGRYLRFDTLGYIWPQNWDFKIYGFSLRCVR